ncbi:hypothetical protein [Vibrio hepatarius]|uniref:hypothetical protein n=1 Tax=Vibrio hepatarius TaxID=171383 RepID=UPI00142D91CD|nr:hypothetical protein [Vibrio hepatarius]NIY83689.1 hypothetical protein [Vibrio hepatarius]
MTNLAAVTKELTVMELHELREEISSLSEALKTVPREYDAAFQQKINRVLDITSEVEHHTRQLRDAINQHHQVFCACQSEQQQAYVESLDKRLSSRYVQQLDTIEQKIVETICEYKRLIFIHSLTVALLTGSVIGGIFYLLAFIL